MNYLPAMEQMVAEAWIEESPLFEASSEDGPILCFNIHIVAELVSGEKLMLKRVFTGWEKGQCQILVKEIQRRQEINKIHWTVYQAWPWEQYAREQTREEEREAERETR